MKKKKEKSVEEITRSAAKLMNSWKIDLERKWAEERKQAKK